MGGVIKNCNHISNDNVYIEEIPGEPGNYALVLEACKENSGNSLLLRWSQPKTTCSKVWYDRNRIKVPDDLPKHMARACRLEQPSSGWCSYGEIDMMEMGHNTFRNEQEFRGK